MNKPTLKYSVEYTLRKSAMAYYAVVRDIETDELGCFLFKVKTVVPSRYWNKASVSRTESISIVTDVGEIAKFLVKRKSSAKALAAFSKVFPKLGATAALLML